MDPVEILKAERAKIVRERGEALARFDDRIAEFDAAVNAIEQRRGKPSAPREASAQEPKKLNIDDAILEAIKNGVRAPSPILKFLANHLGVQTTINSVRTRVSRMSKQGRLAHDDRGWILPSEVDLGLLKDDSRSNAQPEIGDDVPAPSKHEDAVE